MATRIYLDYAATSPIDLRVVAAMSEYSRLNGFNPASQHAAGREARRIWEDAAESICRCLGARVDQLPSDRLIVTSGGTEANNLALLGLARDRPGRVLISRIEHPSGLAAGDELRRRGTRVDLIRARPCGRIDLDHLGQLLDDHSEPVRLVSVMLANNETGVLQPIDEVVACCEPRGIPVHTDAVQVVGKLPVDFTALGVSALTVAAHKFEGPCGIGALLVRGNTPLDPILFGGSQQLGTRPGTEPVTLLVGMQSALQIWHANPSERTAHLRACRDLLEQRLCAQSESIRINGTSERVPQTLNVSFPGIDRQALLMALDFAGICCSTGSACASGSSEPSHVLQAMGLPETQVASAIRLSVGAATSLAEVEQAAERILKAVNQLRL